MTTIPLQSAVTAALLLLALASIAANAEPLRPDAPAASSRVRTTDQRLARLVLEGIRHSPTFRALVDRLNVSDVVVYLHGDAAPPSGIEGRLSFLAAGGGLRYVVVRVAYLPSRARQVAILGHELQHAVEVAETPRIVDPQSLARAYSGTIGYATFSAAAARQTYDSEAAKVMGVRVLREMKGN